MNIGGNHSVRRCDPPGWRHGRTEGTVGEWDVVVQDHCSFYIIRGECIRDPPAPLGFDDSIKKYSLGLQKPYNDERIPRKVSVSCN